MRKRNIAQVSGALALLLVLAGFLTACGEIYTPEVRIRRDNFPGKLNLKADNDKTLLEVTIIIPSSKKGEYTVSFISTDEDVAEIVVVNQNSPHNEYLVTETKTFHLKVNPKKTGATTIVVSIGPPINIRNTCDVTVSGS